MNNKQIFAALEISDYEIRLIVGEFFNTRFNVIKVERVKSAGVVNSRIVDEKLLSDTIRETIKDASNKVGCQISKVLLSVPSAGAIRVPIKVSVRVNSIDKKITILDINNAISKAMSTKVDERYALINAICVKYTCNGITTRRMPLNEISDELICHIDLLCSSREVAFEYVSCVENAGLKILDISLDTFAIAKEACLFEQTVDQNIIVLKLERQSTSLALLHDGRFASCEVIEQGIGDWIAEVSDKFKLPLEVASRLVLYNSKIDSKKTSTSPIYKWSTSGVTHLVSEQELSDTIMEPVEKWADKIQKMSDPIVESLNTQIILTGEGAETEGLKEYLAKKLDCVVKVYTPETFGVRNSALASCLGLFYVYADTHVALGTSESSVNMEEFDKVITYKPIKNDDENTITNKLKSMLFDSKEKE